MTTRWFPYLTRRRYDRGGINDAWSVTSTSIGKSNSEESPYLIANEWVAGSIAQYLRLPIPSFAMLRKRSANTAMFASYSFEGDATPDDADPHECYRHNPDLCTGILLFDIFVLNCDRHRGNLGVDRVKKPRRIHVYDHDHALFYVYEREGIERLKSRKDRLGIANSDDSSTETHCLADIIDTTNHMGHWLKRIEGIPPWYIESVCREVQGIGATKKEITALIEFLIERRTTIGPLLDKHHDRFSKIKQWPLVIT